MNAAPNELLVMAGHGTNRQATGNSRPDSRRIVLKSALNSGPEVHDSARIRLRAIALLCPETRRGQSPRMFIARKTGKGVEAAALVQKATKVPRKVESYRPRPSQRQQQS